MSFFASGLGVGKSSFFGLPKNTNLREGRGNKPASEHSGPSSDVAFSFRAVNSTEPSIQKTESYCDDGTGELSEEDMEVEKYSTAKVAVEESRADSDPTSNLLQQGTQNISAGEDTALEIDTSHETTINTPADETRTPDVSKRTLEPNAEPPCTAEGTSSKRLKMSAPKLFKPSLHVASPSNRQTRHTNMARSSELRSFDLNPIFHSPLKKLPKIQHEVMRSETKQGCREGFSVVGKGTIESTARDEPVQVHAKGSNTEYTETPSEESTGSDKSEIFAVSVSTFEADTEEHISCEDIGITREYLNRVSGLLESGNIQLNESIEMLEKASMDLAIQKHRLLEDDCVLSSVLKLTVGMKKLESLRKRITELDWD